MEKTGKISVEPVTDHRNLKAWVLTIELTADIYELTKKLPSQERYGLSSQSRGAAVPVASNIAEGAGRGSRKEFIRFLYIASGSINELETQLIIVERTGLAFELNGLADVLKKMYKVKRMIHGLVRALNK